MKPYHKNPRKISDKQLNDLRRWLDELGDLSGIVHDLNSDEIIGGNQRTAVLGFSENDITITERLPEPDRQGTIAHGYILWHGARYAYRQVAWTPEQCERANIIANKAGGDWEVDKLLSEFETAVLLQSGFGQDELDNMLAQLEKGKARETADAEPQVSRADELRQEWATETGQLWILPSRTEGQEHRLICGDCTDKAVVERVMGGDGIDLQLTDPPYGINVVQVDGLSGSDGAGKPVTIGAIRGRRPYPVGGVKNMGTVGKKHWVDVNSYAPVEGDDKPFDPSMLLEFPGEKIIFGGNYFASRLPDSRCWIVWDKDNTGNFADAELAWTSFKTGVKLYKFTWNGLVREGERRFEGIKRVHPTQKPVGLFCKILEDYSKDGQIIADFYSGSGTAIIAAENLSRQCRAIEISPAYVAVALQRYLDAFQIRPYLAP